MTLLTKTLWPCALACALGCIENPNGGEQAPDAAARDAAVELDASSKDSANGDATPPTDADPSVCQPQNLWNVIADRAILVGDYCDDIQLCAKTAEVAATVMAIEPGFDCRQPPGQAGCGETERYCIWNDPDELDSDAYAKLCSISTLREAPALLTCLLYL